MTPPPNLLVGAETSDDAAVWRLDENCAIVATADFFAPMIDYPRHFGRVAAANALSDIYAMGAVPMLALALTAFPRASLTTADMADILAGGRDCCNAAGVILAGGHSIDTQEPLYGLAVIGRAQPTEILTNGGAQAGDDVILSKPLGAGLLCAGSAELSEADYTELAISMMCLNTAGSALAQCAGVHALTDITGFGLFGHLLEMCRASACRAQLFAGSVPIFSRAREWAATGRATGASKRNWDSYGGEITAADLSTAQRIIFTDPQTSGGLLVSCAPAATAEVLSLLCAHGSAKAAVIAKMEEGTGVVVV